MNLVFKKPVILFVDSEANKKYYKISISKKLRDGEYDYVMIPVYFTKKDVDLENKTKINIQQSFMSFYRDKDGKATWYIVVKDFNVC